jgi:hypothetical protein
MSSGALASASTVHRVAQPPAAPCPQSPDALDTDRPAIEDEPATGRHPNLTEGVAQS